MKKFDALKGTRLKIKFFFLLISCVSIGNLAYSQTPGMKTEKCHKTETPPTIDGVLSDSEDWNLDQAIVNRIDINGTGSSDPCNDVTPGPASDNTVTFGTKWDDDHFYIAVKCLDANIVKGAHSPAAIGDQLEMFFSMDGRGKFCYASTWPQNYSPNDFQLVNDYGSIGFWSAQPFESAIEKMATKTIPGGVVYEISMTWYDMLFFDDPSVVAEIGYNFGFDLGWSDGDQAGAARNSQLMWNAGSPESITGPGLVRTSNLNWTQDTYFGNVVLEDVPSGIGAAVNEIKNIVNSLSVTPNPSNGQNVVLNVNAKEAQDLNISILNTMSQTLVNTSQSVSVGSNDIVLNTSNLSNGIYFVSICNGSSSMAKKLVVNK